MHVDDVDLLDRKTWAQPYDAYEVLRRDAPVWFDGVSSSWVITRYDDIRAVLGDPKTFSNVFATYSGTGFVPPPTLEARDDPDHRELRRLFEGAFSPGRIRQLESLVEDNAHALIDAFIGEGTCDLVSAFAVPLPLLIIGRQMGVPEQDIWKIKRWTDAWIMGFNGDSRTPDEVRHCERSAAEMHDYFQPIFDRLRIEPDDTLLSHLVNTVVPEWDRPMTDAELHIEMTADTFVGGAETSTNALSAGVMLLIRNPEVWQRVRSDVDRWIDPLVEEVLRLEAPVQSLFRRATRDVRIGGVDIPAESMINVRYGAGNRDETHYESPDAVDLERRRITSHLSFGFGVHACLGARLARRELHHGFRALATRLDTLEFVNPAADIVYQPNFVLRGIKELPIRFTPAGERT